MQRKVPLAHWVSGFTIMPRKPPSYFPGLLNKIQGLSKTAKKNPGLFQDVETLERAVLSESLTHFNLRLAWSS